MKQVFTKTGLEALVVLLAIAVLAVGSCKQAPPEQTETVSLAVSRSGKRLGTIKIPPGKTGKLTLIGRGPDADALKTHWMRAKKQGSVGVDMHQPTQRGKRGGHGTMVYRVGTASWPEGVHYMLAEKNFDVEKSTSP